jgi:ABC-type nitrate/sulfonate/bicarbonate transport system substrate-binding protein
LDGTAAVMTRRILQAKGLDAAKDVSLLSMDTPARLQSLFSGRVAGAMMTPPSIYLAEEKGYKLFGRGRDYMRYLQTGVVSTDSHIKQNREKLVRFLKAWNRGLKAYQESPEIMVPFIQKRLGVKDAQLARRMYDDDAPFVLSGGRLSADAAKDIVEVGREALRIKEPVAPEKIFDFSLAQEAAR